MHRTRIQITLAVLIAQAIAASAQAAAEPSTAPVVVVATRTPSRIDEVLSDVTVIDRAEIARSGQTSLVELLGAQPGIQMTQNGGRGATSSPMIRGANPNQTLVLIDGQRVSSATQGATALEHLPLEMIERIEILRGPGSSLYGADAIGGVILVSTRQGRDQPAPSLFLGAGRYNTTIASAAYGGDVAGTRFNLQAGVEDSKGFSTIKAAKGGFFDMYNPDADGYINRNFSASVAHRVNGDLELAANAFRVEATKHFDATNCDAFASACTTDFDNRLKQYLTSYDAELRYRVMPHWKTTFRLGQGEDKNINFNFDPLAGPSDSRYETRQRQFVWENDFATAAGRLLTAAESRREEVASTLSFSVPSRTTNSLVLGYQGAFGQHALQASGRVDHVERLGSHRTGALAYGYHFTPVWSVHASVGTSFHVPTFNDLYWPVDMANFFQGNPGLRPERGRNRELGLQYDDSTTRAGVTLYRNHVTDLINYQNGAAPTYIGTMANLNQATLKGATFQYERRAGAWRWKAGYDVLSARDDASDRVLQRRAPRAGALELRRQGAHYAAGLQLAATSARFNDAANRQTLGGYGVVNLDVAWPLRKDLVLTAKLNNLFDKDYVLVRSTLSPFNDYAVSGRNLFVGLRYTPGK